MVLRLNPDMSPEERSMALLRVAIKDKDHLKRWLSESGRRWMVFDALDLVDSLTWPEGVLALMEIIAAYREYRMGIESGNFELQVDPTLGKEIKVPIMKDELLEIAEL
ncbi:MAG: hypothetical protein KAT58_10550, partial [candidate division Zixibacteria bacterium]|nr:hypothetical protein [candidate division Zixibacteria bacterium]